jgi:hypothetical protein
MFDELSSSTLLNSGNAAAKKSTRLTAAIVMTEIRIRSDTATVRQIERAAGPIDTETTRVSK